MLEWTHTCTAQSMDYAKKVKLRFRVGNLELPGRRKRYTSSREEEDVATNMCACGTTIKTRTNLVGECEICKEELDALEETRKLDVCDMEEIRRLETSEKTIAILRDRWWPQTAKQDEDRIRKQFMWNIWKKRNERPNVEGVFIRLLGVGTVLCLERDAWSMVKLLRQATSEYSPPTPLLSISTPPTISNPSWSILTRLRRFEPPLPLRLRIQSLLAACKYVAKVQLRRSYIKGDKAKLSRWSQDWDRTRYDILGIEPWCRHVPLCYVWTTLVT